ncbi:hypothetical protein BH23ACT6_BH23ACT6_22130 [soil metagenome]
MSTERANSAVARQYQQKTVEALNEIVRLTDVGARLAQRGHDWYVADPDNAPGLACEGLVIKIGENVARIDATFQAGHPEIPWRVVKGMRNRLTHYYETTDYEVVWSTVVEDFPQIRAMIVALTWSEGARVSVEAWCDAIILAGGSGQRLGGVDKALIEVNGQTLLGYAVSATSAARHVIVVGAPRPGYDQLSWTREDPPGGGPASGVVAGMDALAEHETQSPWVVLLAVDQPGAVAAVAALLRAAADVGDDIDGLCPHDDAGHPQWLLGAYRRESLARACRTVGDGHGVSIGRLLGDLRLTDAPDAAAHAGDVDTWADKRAWEMRLQT